MRVLKGSNTNYQVFKEQVTTALIDRAHIYGESQTREFVDGFKMMILTTDPRTQNKIMKVSSLVDQSLEETTKYNKRYITFPAIFTAITLLNAYSDSVSDLLDEEIALLSSFSCLVRSDSMPEHLELFADKRLLSTVFKKTDSELERWNYMHYIESNYYEQAIDKSSPTEYANFKSEMCSFVKNADTNDVARMNEYLDEKYMEALDSVKF